MDLCELENAPETQKCPKTLSLIVEVNTNYDISVDLHNFKFIEFIKVKCSSSYILGEVDNTKMIIAKILTRVQPILFAHL